MIKPNHKPVEKKLSTLSDDELQAVFQALTTRYKLDFSNYEKTYLKRRISRIMHRHQLASVIDLWQKILYDVSFIENFINEITVGLTELFRNPELWRYLRTNVLPSFKQPIQILHTGCSTGEEVYSMLITLHESICIQAAQITATDINTAVLQTAAKGLLEQVDIKAYQRNYQTFTHTQQTLDYYFDYDAKQESLQWKKHLQHQVKFEKQNLIQDNIKGTYDLIFCRNVLIYFDEPLKISILEKLAQALKPDGFLILGYYDSLPTQIEILRTYAPEYKIYQKA